MLLAAGDRARVPSGNRADEISAYIRDVTADIRAGRVASLRGPAAMNKPYEPPCRTPRRRRWLQDYAEAIRRRTGRDHARAAIKPLYRRADTGAANAYARDGRLSRPAAVHPADLPTDASRPDVDAAPADRLSTPSDYNARLPGQSNRAGRDSGVALPPRVPRLRPWTKVERGALGTLRRGRQHRRPHGHLPPPASTSGRTSCAMNDRRRSRCTRSCSPPEAARRGWTGSAARRNQSDYLSHYVANHMFFRWRCRPRGACCSTHRVLQFATSRTGNPMSGRGQHMQQAGATPAEAMRSRSPPRCSRRRLRRARRMAPDDSCRSSPSSSTSRLSFFEEIGPVPRGRRSGPGSPASATGEGSRAGASSSTRRPPASTSPGRSRTTTSPA